MDSMTWVEAIHPRKDRSGHALIRAGHTLGEVMNEAAGKLFGKRVRFVDVERIEGGDYRTQPYYRGRALDVGDGGRELSDITLKVSGDISVCDDDGSASAADDFRYPSEILRDEREAAAPAA